MGTPADMRGVEVRRVSRTEPGIVSARPAPIEQRKRPRYESDVRAFLASKRKRVQR